MKDFISLLFDNWKKIKKRVTIFNVITSICLFIVFLKRIYNDNQIIISIEQILLWIKSGIYKLIPEYIFESVYDITKIYYDFVFEISTAIFILISCIIIWSHDRWLFGESILGINFRKVLWKRIGYYKFIKFTFGSGYIFYKIIEFIYLGRNNISSNSYELLIVLLQVFAITIYLLQILFYVPEEKESKTCNTK